MSKIDSRKNNYQCRAIERIVSGRMSTLYDVYKRPSDAKRHAWAIIEEERNIYRRRDGDIVSKVFIISSSVHFFTCAFLYQPGELDKNDWDKNDWVMKIYTPYDSWVSRVQLSDSAIHNALDTGEFRRWKERPQKGADIEAGNGEEDTSKLN